MKKTQEVLVGRVPKGPQKIQVVQRLFDTTKLASEFTLAKKWKSGKFKMSKDLNLDSEVLSKEQAVNIAYEFVKKLPLPKDAFILEPEPLYLSNSEHDVVIFAYTVSFTHPYNGCVLAGDHITLIVQADGVKMVTAFWHDITPIEGQHKVVPFTNEDLKTSFEGLRRFYAGIQSVPNVQYIRPVYYCFDAEIQDPQIVWEVCFDGGRRVFLDVVAKEVPNL